jgi:CDP-diacylglycerol pyrophosphatase
MMDVFGSILRRCALALCCCWLGALPLTGQCTGRPASPVLSSRDVLWNLVQEKCLPSPEKPECPCLHVDPGPAAGKGYAVIKDNYGTWQLLLIPTAKITGIESPELVAPESTNYFGAAWEMRKYNSKLALLPRREVGLAVNSFVGRSQDQLHIHIDCLRREVVDALQQAAVPSRGWSPPLALPPDGHRYFIRRVGGEELHENPFRMLKSDPPLPRRAMTENEMARWTVAVAGAEFGKDPGFLVLASRADPAALNHAEAEELQDHTCAIAPEAPVR